MVELVQEGDAVALTQHVFKCLSVISCVPVSLQPRLQQREHEQQVALSVGEDLLQLGLHCPICVDPGGSAGAGQQGF